ncbi:hypothetical protein J4418_03780 [Candidatus Woesearchaeota archaeon]|nr:hypothetical protein [Candidatus Woesearchaeota archaeon]
MSELFYKMQQIITNDDSITYYNKQYQETYHSKSGAVEESIKKFVEPAMIKEKSKKGSIKILDICFGLGYNSAAVIDEVLKYNKDCSIEIVGLENDISIIEKIQEVNPKFLSYNFIKSLNQNNLSIKVDNVSVKLLIGDARELITTLKEDFDIIFLDPFSPKKCPELWTESFFKDIKKLTLRGTILTTYSCAKLVRNNLKTVGFTVKDGPCVGRRAPSTIAFID